MATGITPEFLQALYQATFAPQEAAVTTGRGRKQLAQRKRAFQQDLLNQVNKPVERQLERVIGDRFSVPEVARGSRRGTQVSIANLRDPEALASLAITGQRDREKRRAAQERQGLLSLSLKPEVIESLQAQGYDPYQIMSATSQEPDKRGNIEFSGKVLEGVLRPELFAGLGSYTTANQAFAAKPFDLTYKLSDRAPVMGPEQAQARLTQRIGQQLESGRSPEQVQDFIDNYVDRAQRQAEARTASVGETLFVPEGGQTQYTSPYAGMDTSQIYADVLGAYQAAGSPVVAEGEKPEPMQSFQSWLARKVRADLPVSRFSSAGQQRAYQRQVVNKYNEAQLPILEQELARLQEPVSEPFYLGLLPQNYQQSALGKMQSDRAFQAQQLQKQIQGMQPAGSAQPMSAFQSSTAGQYSTLQYPPPPAQTSQPVTNNLPWYYSSLPQTSQQQVSQGQQQTPTTYPLTAVSPGMTPAPSGQTNFGTGLNSGIGGMGNALSTMIFNPPGGSIV